MRGGERMRELLREEVTAVLDEDVKRCLRPCLRCGRSRVTDKYHRICPRCSKINEQLAGRAMCAVHVRCGPVMSETLDGE